MASRNRCQFLSTRISVASAVAKHRPPVALLIEAEDDAGERLLSRYKINHKIALYRAAYSGLL